MITKEQYLDLLKSEFKDKDRKDYYKSLNVLFSYEFMSFLEENFIKHDEIIKITHSYKFGTGKYYDDWTEERFNEILLNYTINRVKKVFEGSKNSSEYSRIWTIELGISKILELNFPMECFDVKYKGFYSKHVYGFLGMPLHLDILKHFNKLDIIPEQDAYGIDAEKEIVFDMSKWKEYFPNSKQLTTLKEEFDPGWTEDDWYYNEDGTLNEDENSESYYNRESNKMCKGKKPHKYYDRDMYEIRQITGCNTLRRINIGNMFACRALNEFGYIIGYSGPYPILKLKTSLGFSFYARYDGYGYNEPFIDDVNIKKVVFGDSKPKNLEKMTTPREFIIYNKTTGFWRLPKLYYPEKYKNFIKVILKHCKKVLGPWSDTCVYANSRTLCGDTYSFNLDYFPDITDINDISNTVKDMIKAILSKNSTLNKIIDFANINIDIDATIKDPTFIKDLNIITQEDIDMYCSSESTTGITIEYYDKKNNDTK